MMKCTLYEDGVPETSPWTGDFLVRKWGGLGTLDVTAGSAKLGEYTR